MDERKYMKEKLNNGVNQNAGQFLFSIHFLQGILSLLIINTTLAVKYEKCTQKFSQANYRPPGVSFCHWSMESNILE